MNINLLSQLDIKKDSESFTTDNLKIYVTFTYSTIFLKIMNNLTFHNYELTIYEPEIIDKRFRIDELYQFILKSLKKLDNHNFTCNVTPVSMKISLNALFNSYFKISYDIILNKKETSISNDLMNINKNNDKISDILIEELKQSNMNLKKEYDTLLNNFNKLSESFDMSEISFGYIKYDSNIINNIFTTMNVDVLFINLIVDQYTVLLSAPYPGLFSKEINFSKQIIIDFSKIKKLKNLKKIYSYAKVSTIVYDDITNSIVSNKLLDDYCENNNIEICLV